MGLFPTRQPVTVTLPGGEPLVCRLCEGERFRPRRFLLSPDWLAFFDLEWMSRRAHCFVCADCGFIHWFSWPRAALRKVRT